MRRKVKRFPDGLKLVAVKEYLSTGISQAELKLKCGLRGACPEQLRNPYSPYNPYSPLL